MLIKELKKPSKVDADRFLKEHNYTSCSVEQFRLLLKDLADLFGVPFAIAEEIAKLEIGFPDKPSLLKSNSYEVSTSFRGPFQIGEGHWKDSIKHASALGLKFPQSRLVASLGQQGFATFNYLRAYGSTFPAIGRQPLDMASVYLVHNQGPGAAKLVFEGKEPPKWLKANLKGQSGPARALLSRRYSL